MNKGAHSSKRRQFDIKFKRNLIDEFDKLQSKGKVNKSLFSLNHGITPSTFTTILAQRDKLFKANKKGIVGDTKRLRVCPYQQLNDALTIWFKQLSAMKCPVSGPFCDKRPSSLQIRWGFLILELKISDMFRK